ncbi:hypothetical protein RKD23_007691 [Streptomyces sp. SAI-170]
MMSDAPLLSVHAAVVFLRAVINGFVIGGLMFLHDKSRVMAPAGPGGGTHLCLIGARSDWQGRRSIVRSMQ